MKKYLWLSFCLLLPLLVGATGSFFTRQNIPTWYVSLAKPSFNPPNWIFGPVWTLLYLLMGWGLFLVLQKKSKFKKAALFVFGIQLFLNFCWSFLFFGEKKITWALVDIAFLWLSIGAMIFVFYKVDKTAALLQIPYWLWVSFASILNYSIWVLNR